MPSLTGRTQTQWHFQTLFFYKTHYKLSRLIIFRYIIIAIINTWHQFILAAKFITFFFTLEKHWFHVNLTSFIIVFVTSGPLWSSMIQEEQIVDFTVCMKGLCKLAVNVWKWSRPQITAKSAALACFRCGLLIVFFIFCNSLETFVLACTHYAPCFTSSSCPLWSYFRCLRLQKASVGTKVWQNTRKCHCSVFIVGSVKSTLFCKWFTVSLLQFNTDHHKGAAETNRWALSDSLKLIATLYVHYKVAVYALH